LHVSESLTVDNAVRILFAKPLEPRVVVHHSPEHAIVVFLQPVSSGANPEFAVLIAAFCVRPVDLLGDFNMNAGWKVRPIPIPGIYVVLLARSWRIGNEFTHSSGIFRWDIMNDAQTLRNVVPRL
jgi:hypothetical protein